WENAAFEEENVMFGKLQNKWRRICSCWLTGQMAIAVSGCTTWYTDCMTPALKNLLRPIRFCCTYRSELPCILCQIVSVHNAWSRIVLPVWEACVYICPGSNHGIASQDQGVIYSRTYIPLGFGVAAASTENTGKRSM
ncbi:hypothetical protein J0S82_015830, partial [Galemys pyrenaicus]